MGPAWSMPNASEGRLEVLLRYASSCGVIAVEPVAGWYRLVDAEGR